MPPLIEPLGPQHDRGAFASGSEPLDRYLRQQAGQDMRNSVAAVFVLRLPDAPAVRGYYTLSAGTIAPSELDPALARRLPRYDLLPVVLLGRLAVHRECRGRGYGKLLLVDALRRGFESRTRVGAMAVTVEAKDDGARAFYEHYGFVRFAGHEYRLYLPMKTIARLAPEQPANRVGG